MKRHNAGVILLLIACDLAVGILAGIIMGPVLKIAGFKEWIILTVPLMFLPFRELANLIMFPIAGKTMEKNLKEQNFGKTTTFINTDLWSLKAMLCIDESTGRVAYTSVTNPFTFQMVHAGELSKIRTVCVKGPFGGTRYVFFEFYHGNNRLRFPTFRTGRQTWLISSARVQNAIATGENICSLLLKFNPGGNDFTVNRNAPFSKTALWGFFFSFVSVFLAVVTMISELYLSSVYSGLEQKAANGMTAYVLAFLAAAPAVTGLVLGANVLRKSSVSPVRGIGFARTSVIMSSVVLALLLLTMALYLFG